MTASVSSVEMTRPSILIRIPIVVTWSTLVSIIVIGLSLPSTLVSVVVSLIVHVATSPASVRHTSSPTSEARIMIAIVVSRASILIVILLVASLRILTGSISTLAITCCLIMSWRTHLLRITWLVLVSSFVLWILQVVKCVLQIRKSLLLLFVTLFAPNSWRRDLVSWRSICRSLRARGERRRLNPLTRIGRRRLIEVDLVVVLSD